jgi:hypothetical protein
MTLKELSVYVLKTYEIDESGDASLDEFFREQVKNDAYELGRDWAVKDFLESFLVWANGPKWKEFLDNAKPGDYPSKG